MTSESSAEKHVLVVEDEPDFADLLKSILTKAGYSVAIALDSASALSQVRESRPDLITLDLQMPRESGLFFYRALKSDENYRGIPVVVVTGVTRDDRDMENIVRTFLEPDHLPHPEAYVDKPVDRAHFLATIEDRLAPSAAGSC